MPRRRAKKKHKSTTVTANQQMDLTRRIELALQGGSGTPNATNYVELDRRYLRILDI